MLSPDDRCSTRPLNRRRPGPPPVPKCTTNARCAESVDPCSSRGAIERPPPSIGVVPQGLMRDSMAARAARSPGEGRGLPEENPREHRGARHEAIANGRRPPVRIEVENECAWRGEQRLQLMPRAFAVLRHLVDHAGRLITKEELLTRVWRDAIVSEAALTTCIRDLRKALGDSSDTPRYIETVHRRGFRFIGPIAGPTTPRFARAAARRAVEQGSSPATATLVGRDAELARLHELLGRAMDRRRQLVFVTGEPGIGKTALVEAFLAGIGLMETLRIGRGQCVEQYGAGEAYLPVLEALGRLGREPARRPARSRPQAACADLARAVAGAVDRRGSGGRAAPGSGGDARADAARAGGGPRYPHRRLAPRPGPGRPALERLGHDRPARDARASA